jgi:hypothetical protein
MTLAVAKWSRIPSADKRPVNMSLVSAGTTVTSASGMTPSAGLVLGDPLRPIRVAGGNSEAILKLVRQSYVEKASFVSEGLEGSVSASISTDGKAWKNETKQVFTATDRLITLSMGIAQGRYVRLQFDLVRGGVIRSFQLLGSHSDANYKVSQTENGKGAKVNFASGIGGGRLIYINPEDFSARNMAASTGLSFPESDEKYRTAVYDLGQVRSLTEFGSLHSPRPVRMSVYAFETLPEKEDWRGRLAFDPGALDTAQPVASAEDAAGTGVIQVKTRTAVKARYVALRWEPDFNPPAFDVITTVLSGLGITSFGSGGATVETTTDANGNTVYTVTMNGETMQITVDADGNITTSGSLGTSGDTPSGTDPINDNGAPPIVNPNPSSVGDGIGSPQSNGNDGRKQDDGSSPSDAS